MGTEIARRNLCNSMSNRLFSARQTTINQEIEITGIGVHSGAQVTITISPAGAGTGIKFISRTAATSTASKAVASASSGLSTSSDVMTDMADDCKAQIDANYQSVSNVTLCTVLSGENGAHVATVEHLIAAFRGLNIDNAVIEVDSHEIPIMDGSARPFVEALLEAGIKELPAQRRFIKVLRPVRVSEGGGFCEFTPHDGFHFDVEIDFDSPVIGRQRYQMELTPERFCAEVAAARTFGFIKDVEHLWASGRALGASFKNTVALDDDRVLNPEGLRFEDEFVRHKLLDAIGDVALAGAPIVGAFRSYRGGHRLNYLAVKTLLEDSSAWTIIEAPRIREIRYADFARSLEAAHMGAPRN